jgi:hypothetical protein
MKKILLIGLLTFLPILTFSQNKIGIFAGGNASTFSDGILESFGIHSNSFSFHLGAVYEYQFSEKISFRPKLVFSQQGDREDYDDTIKYEVTYLNLPINFKFFNNPYIIAGPQIGFLLDTKKRESDFGDLKTLDYGLNLGIGIDIKDFFIELNLYQGFNELIEVEFNHPYPISDTNIKATNTLVQLSIGYNFEL